MIHGLFIGCDYRGTSSQLAGCIADANAWRGSGYRPELPLSPGEMCERPTMLIERDATKANVIDALKHVAGRCPRGGDDWGLVTYSGHGTHRRGTDSGEIDGEDEAICCYDFLTGGLLWDNEIGAILGGSQTLLITDCCHSHTLTRNLPVVADAEPLATPRYIPFDQITEGLAQCEIDRLCEPANRFRAQARSQRNADGSIPGLIHLAGCLDSEYSYDTGKGGAMTLAALAVYRTLGVGDTYAKWIDHLGRHLPTRNYPQHPQLTATSADLSRVVIGRYPPAPAVPPSQQSVIPATVTGTLTLGGKTYDVRERT